MSHSLHSSGRYNKSKSLRDEDVVAKRKRINELKKEQKAKTKEEQKANRKKNRAENIKTLSYIGSHGTNFFSIIVVLLVAVAMIRILYNGTADTISFGSLLNLLESAPQVSNDVKTFVQQFGFTEPWVVLDGFRVFLNVIMDIWSILIWMGSSLIDVIIFVGYFLAWIFLV